MQIISIRLDNFQKLRKFVDDCAGIDAELKIVSGSSTIDAKSIMGLVSLDLSNPLQLRIKAKHGQCPKILDALEEYRA